MKNLLTLGLLITALLFAVSCGEDDPVNLDPPTLTPPTATSVKVGETVTIDFLYTAAAGFKSSSVSQTGGTATITTDGTTGAESGTITVTFVAGTTAGAGSVVLTVVDNEDDTQLSTAVITIAASAVPTIAGIPASATIKFGETLSVPDVILTAEDGFASANAFTVAVGSVELDLSALITGVSPQTVIVAADIATQESLGVTSAGGSFDLVFTLTDTDGDVAIFTHVLTVTEPIVDIFSSDEGVVADSEASQSITWTKDNIYVLRGFVFVNDGEVLTIEEGTVIKGQPGQGAGASALIVARGGQLIAEGTDTEPIIFTGLADDLNGSVADDASGLWGGLIMLGNATNNANASSNLLAIEGIPETEPRGIHGYGDTFALDAADDSGSLKYVSVRHGGSLIGSDNEINGITLGSVGSGTTMENIEIFGNLDDGIEFFGGTVDVKNLIVANAGDDGIDIDNGFTGSIQNAIVWTRSQSLDSSDPTGAELDGATGNDEGSTGTPFATPQLANITWVFEKSGNDGLTQAIHMRDNYGGSIYNSIIFGHDAPIQIEDTDKSSSTFDLFTAGTLIVSNNMIFSVNAATDLAGTVKVNNLDTDATFAAHVTANNEMVDPAFGTGASKFTPSAAAASTGAKSDLNTIDEALENTSYKGAIDPAGSGAFFDGWSKLSEVIQ